MASRKRKRSRWADDAALQALVRYGPEESGLRALAQQARADYGTSVRQARGTAASIVDATQRAIPNVRGIYDRAGLDQARTASLVSSDVAGLSGVANTIKAGMALEVAQQLGNLRSARSAALEDLETRQVAARQGEGFAVQSARRKYESDISKLLERSQGLAREKGAFRASTINALAEKDADRVARETITRIQQSGQNRRQEDQQAFQSGEKAKDRALRRETARASRTPSGRKLNPSGEHRSVRDEISKGVAALRTLDPDRDVSRWGSLGNLLQSGHKGQDLKDPRTGKTRVSRSGVPMRTPDVPQIGSLSARVALDLYYHGGVSRETKQRIWQSGYSVEQLGLKGKRIAPKSPLAAMRNPFTARVRG